MTGRTKTAMSVSQTSTPPLRVGVISCTSVYSGYFHALRTLAVRDDIDLVLHLGDTIYDTVGKTEQTRVPEPCDSKADPITGVVCVQEEPKERIHSLDQYRNLFRYNFLDVDYRYLRSRLPIVAIRDNHDLDDNTTATIVASTAAFFEYWPVRGVSNSYTSNFSASDCYREIKYGSFVHIIVMDEQTVYREPSSPEGRQYASMLGNSQFQWLTSTLKNSSKIFNWRLIGGQKVFTRWSLEVPLVQGGPPLSPNYLDDSQFDGYPLERTALLSFMRDNYIRNNVIVGGDIHVGLAADVYDFPGLAGWVKSEYCPSRLIECTGKVTYDWSVGVEFVPPSVNRMELSFEKDSIKTFGQIGQAINPHHLEEDMLSHGFGVLEFYFTHVVAYTVDVEYFSQSLSGPTEKTRFYSCSWDQLYDHSLAYHSNHWDDDCSCSFRSEDFWKCLPPICKLLIVLGSIAGALFVISMLVICFCPRFCCWDICMVPSQMCGCLGCCYKSCGENPPWCCVCCTNPKRYPN